jgi:prolyl oligopeptidase
VVPAHSFKFIATLQEKSPSLPTPSPLEKGLGDEAPLLIRIDINAGHAAATTLGSSKPVAKQIDEQTDIFSFIMYNLGVKY